MFMILQKPVYSIFDFLFIIVETTIIFIEIFNIHYNIKLALSFKKIQKQPTTKKQKDSFSKDNPKNQDYNQAYIVKSDSMKFNFSDINIFDTNKIDQNRQSYSYDLFRSQKSRPAPKPLDIQYIQAKLKVNTPGDTYEREADRLAEQLIDTHEHNCECGGTCPKCQIGKAHSPEKLLMKRVGSDLGKVQVPHIVDEVLNSPGKPLDEITRGFMEPKFGHKFNHVRIHTDSKAIHSAAAINARAYTVGRDVVFGHGQFSPMTAEGQKLLAHELVHVIQQNGNATAVQRQLNDDEEDEEDEEPVVSGPKPISLSSLVDPSHMYGGSKPMTDEEIYKLHDEQADKENEQDEEDEEPVVSGPKPISLSSLVDPSHMCGGSKCVTDEEINAPILEYERRMALEKEPSHKFSLSTELITKHKLISPEPPYDENVKNLGSELFLYASAKNDYSIVNEVLFDLPSYLEDDVALAMMEKADVPTVETFAKSERGRYMLDRIFDDLATGDVDEREMVQIDKILGAKASINLIPYPQEPEEIKNIKIFPFRLPGFTVGDSAPIIAERRAGGKIWVKIPDRVRADYPEEAKTGIYHATLHGVELNENEMIGIKNYESGELIYRPALYLIALSSQSTERTFDKMKEAVFIVGSVGMGGIAASSSKALAAIGITASWVPRVIQALDVLAFSWSIISSVIDEHKAFFSSKFPGFMKVAGVINSAVSLYGFARIGLEMPLLIKNFRNRYAPVKNYTEPLDNARQGDLKKLTDSTDEFLEEVEVINKARDASRSPTSAGSRSQKIPDKTTPMRLPESKSTPHKTPDKPSSSPRKLSEGKPTPHKIPEKPSPMELPPDIATPTSAPKKKPASKAKAKPAPKKKPASKAKAKPAPKKKPASKAKAKPAAKKKPASKAKAKPAPKKKPASKAKAKPAAKKKPTEPSKVKPADQVDAIPKIDKKRYASDPDYKKEMDKKIDWKRYQTDKKYAKKIDKEYGIPSGKTPGTFESKPEEILATNLEKQMGSPRPVGHEAHHIVLKKGGGMWAEKTRDILKNAGVDINEGSNGIWLPKTSLDPKTIPEVPVRHQPIHTEPYFKEVYKRLKRYQKDIDPIKIRDELHKIRSEISDDKFPY
jgi:hypothetical protein